MSKINLNWIFTKNTLIGILMIACAVMVLMLTCNKPVLVPPVVKVETKEVIKEIAKDSAAHKKTIDSLRKINTKLNSELGEKKEDLLVAQELVTELLNDAGQAIDTSTQQQLRAQLEIVKKANTIKDSLTNQTIRTQDSINTNLSIQLAQKDSFYYQLRTSFNQVVENEQVKDKHIVQLNKQIKRSGQKITFKNIAIGVLAGALIYQTAK